MRHDIIAEVVRYVRETTELNIPDNITFEVDPTHVDEIETAALGAADLVDNIVYLSSVLMLLTPRALVEVLIHELVHIDQAQTGMLTADDETDELIWFGHRFPVPDNVEDYHNAPWERDANRREAEISPGAWRYISRTCGPTIMGKC